MDRSTIKSPGGGSKPRGPMSPSFLSRGYDVADGRKKEEGSLVDGQDSDEVTKT